MGLGLERFGGFDIEIDQLAPEEGGFDALRKAGGVLGVTCCAVHFGKGKAPVWYAGKGGEADLEGKELPARMTRSELDGLIDWIKAIDALGWKLVTWNGAGFDFRVLYNFPARYRWELRKITREHIDMAYQMLCEKGFMCSLSSACQAMGLGAKMEGVEGATAPEMWKDGRVGQDLVIEYVQQDAFLTTALYASIVTNAELKWVTAKGTVSSYRPRLITSQWETRMLTVEECNKLPVPDTSWMDAPRSRASYTDWLYANSWDFDTLEDEEEAEEVVENG